MNRLPMRAYITVAIIFPMVCCAQSLQEAVQIALQNYPAIEASKARTEAAQADILRAKAPHWPQLSWSGTYNDYRSKSLSNRWVQSPTLSLNLWSGGRIQSDIERSESLFKASQFQQSIAQDDVALLSSEAYMQWAHFREMVFLSQENLVQHEKILNDFQKIFAVDKGRQIDLNQAQVRFENAKISLMKNESEMETSMQRVSRMLNRPLPAEPTGIEFSSNMPFSSLEQAQANLNSQHPVLANLNAQRDAAQSSIRYAQAQDAATVNLTHTKITNAGFADGKYVTQLQLNIPLIDGGSANSALEGAVANLKVLEYTLNETQLILGEELKVNWKQWISAKQRAEIGQQQIQTTKELALGYGQQFQVGRRSLLDLLNIQSDLYTYQSNAATAMQEARIAKERILATLGQLAKQYTQAPTRWVSYLDQKNSDSSRAKEVEAQPLTTRNE